MNAHEKTEAGYLSYMIRMWRKWDGNGKPMWCASVQEPGNRRTENFEDANAMFAFLRRQMGMEEPAEHAPLRQEPHAHWESKV